MAIDFRSDTVTRPSPAMLDAMFKAPVGDDVFGEDPSINELENMAASLFGMEAAIFCPSGTMTNQIAIKCHTQPGDEVITDKVSHVYKYEGGGIGFNSGCSVSLINGHNGRITADQVREAINPDDAHKPVTKLVSLENTSNRGGGSCYDFNEIIKIRQVCDEYKLGLHLDGARLFNALVARKESALQYGETFDSISICLSKSLGAPVGSLLLGKEDFIKKAHRIRKVLGGGMRQAGYIAAAGKFALENNIERLEQDHIYAREIAHALWSNKYVDEMLPVETNIIIFSTKGDTPQQFKERMKDQGVLISAISSTQVRMVMHLDITPEMVKQTIEIIERL